MSGFPTDWGLNNGDDDDVGDGDNNINHEYNSQGDRNIARATIFPSDEEEEEDDDDDDDDDEDENKYGYGGQGGERHVQRSARAEAQIRARRTARRRFLRGEKGQSSSASSPPASLSRTKKSLSPPCADKKPAARHIASKWKAPPPTSAPSGKKSPPTPTTATLSKKNKRYLPSSSPSTASSASPSANRVERRKETLLRKVLAVKLSGSSGTTAAIFDPTVVQILDVDQFNLQTIASILASRLAMTSLSDTHQRKGFIIYLTMAYYRAEQELKLLRNASNSVAPEEMDELLQEIRYQCIRYAASCLIVPDLFPVLAKNGTQQLAQALLQATTETRHSTVVGGKPSFFTSLCDELQSQDPTVFRQIIRQVLDHLVEPLSSKHETTLLDSKNIDSSRNDDNDQGEHPIKIVAALTLMCQQHKGVAQLLVERSDFTLPRPDSEEAQVVVHPPPPTFPSGTTPQHQQFLRLLQMMRNHAAYLRRSGPAIEKETWLGKLFAVGIPRDSPSVSQAFPAVLASMDSVEKVTQSLQRQLSTYQQQLFLLIKSLLTAGPTIREQVMDWFLDALLVNSGATAIRPDAAKVSRPVTLMNLCRVLLQLCEPFLNKPEKLNLLHPGFVMSPSDHGGLYATSGENIVSRLGGAGSAADWAARLKEEEEEQYNPRNKFVPRCFFLAARALHLSLVPLASFHHNLLRQIGHTHHELQQRNADLASDPQFAHLLGLQRANEVTLFEERMISATLRFCDCMAAFFLRLTENQFKTMPEHFVDDICDILQFIPKTNKAKLMAGHKFQNVFRLVVKLLSPQYASMVRNYNLRAKLGDVLYEVYLPSEDHRRRHIPSSVYTVPGSSGQTYLRSDPAAQETLAPSLLLLYGEVEHTGYYEKMGHRANIASLLKYLWGSKEHRSAFKRITQNKDSFIKFANGIMNETNSLIASVMEKLPQIRQAQLQMGDTEQWSSMNEEQRETITGRLEENEADVKRALPLCNKTLQMLGFLNTDEAIRSLFLLEEMCARLVNMLLHVLTKLVGSNGMELRVNNPEEYNFRPKEMLRDLCAIFSLFSSEKVFVEQCAHSGYYNDNLMRKAVGRCAQLTLLSGQSLRNFQALPDLLKAASDLISDDDAILGEAPDEFMDPLLMTFMKDPVFLPTSETIVDRSTIMQHLLNDPTDPFNRRELTMDMVVPATELRQRMDEWLGSRRAAVEETKQRPVP